MTVRKKLIEVALPLEAINAESALRKQKAPKGYPTAIHKWWAQVPIASCRAVLFGQLVDDPSAWPELFPTEEAQGAERKRLHDFIAELVKWERSNDERVLNQARWYIARSIAWGRGEEPPDDPEAVRSYLLEHAPPVYDPFCGGGSIPLEAQRLGLRAYGSDLNPVAVMISKALVEFPPKFAGLAPVNPEAKRKLASGGAWNAKGAQGLAEDVRYYGRWMRDEAEKRIGHLYPRIRITPELAASRPDLKDLVGQELMVIAWLWTRTVASSSPACRGMHVPLVSSFILSIKPGRETWIEPVIDSRAPDGYRFEIRTGKSDLAAFSKSKEGTKASRGANFTCVLTGAPLTPGYIKAEGKAKRMGIRLMAIVAESKRGRIYLPPIQEQTEVARRATPAWKPEFGLSRHPQYMGVAGYGLETFDELFTPRQIATLDCFADLLPDARAKTLEDAASLGSDLQSVAKNAQVSAAYADAVTFYLGMAFSRLVHYNTAQCTWLVKDQAVAKGLPQQALPMVWDFAEGNPFGKSSSEIMQCIKNIADCINETTPVTSSNIILADAREVLINKSNILVCTDPPYYDNVPYADLSDFFYVWLRRALKTWFPQEFATLLVPKSLELVADRQRHGSKEEADRFFYEGMVRVVSEMYRAGTDDAPCALYYAFKQREIEQEGIVSTGWATFLSALIDAGMQVDGTWPVRAQNASRLRSLGSNALASSIVIACRKRPRDVPNQTRGGFLRALQKELPAALHTLQEAAIAPVDMAQASIGPGMAVFSRYKEVLEADDSRMSVREALRLINAELDAFLTEQEGEHDSWTRFAVTWFQQHGFETGPFGDANTIANARDVSVQGVEQAGIIESRAGKVRLLTRDELPDDYVPFTDSRQTVWEGCQHLIKRLEGQGEEGAARVARQLGYQADMARDLAYRLYQVCERNKWAEEARAYNGLIESWREIIKIRDKLPDETTPGPREPELLL